MIGRLARLATAAMLGASMFALSAAPAHAATGSVYLFRYSGGNQIVSLGGNAGVAVDVAVWGAANIGTVTSNFPISFGAGCFAVASPDPQRPFAGECTGITGFDEVLGSNGNDFIRVNSPGHMNFVYGNDGHDLIYSNSNVWDEVWGQGGQDTIVVNQNPPTFDKVHCGANDGQDVVYLNYIDQKVSQDCGSNDIFVYGP